MAAMGFVATYIHGLCDPQLALAAEKRRRSSDRRSQGSATDDDDEGINDAEDVDNDLADIFTSRNVSQLQRVRDSILDILIERAHDKSHYTRATVLKVK